MSGLKISEAEFKSYEAVRRSGVTNMFMVNVVSELSGLSRDKIVRIMKKYDKLNTLYPGVRK